jgi:hypothetical protein
LINLKSGSEIAFYDRKLKKEVKGKFINIGKPIRQRIEYQMLGNEFLSHRLQSTCYKHSMMPISDMLKLSKKRAGSVISSIV